MADMMKKSKADRDALVGYALEALKQLSAHLTYTLTGLRLGQDRGMLLNVKSYAQLHLIALDCT